MPYILILFCLVLCNVSWFAQAQPKVPLVLQLQKGPIADNGATPWVTGDIRVGASQIALALDTGSDFIWVTSDLCTTPACQAHLRVVTTQPGWMWVDKTPRQRDFGPWGSMTTYTAQIPWTVFLFDGARQVPTQFFPAVNYSGDNFQNLAWDGGIGFPARSIDVTEGSTFFFLELLKNGIIDKPVFSMVTYPTFSQPYGYAILGGDDPTDYIPDNETILTPATSSPYPDTWGTPLYHVKIGETELPDLQNIVFYMDSGSSRFKGDAKYIYPMLQTLLDTKDSSGNAIFEKIMEIDPKSGQEIWVGLQFINANIPLDKLPLLRLTLGQSCGGASGVATEIALNAQQYSYVVEQGDRVGKRVVAVHRLDGIGGLLVGATLMDYIHTRFEYNYTNGVLTQGNMYLNLKVEGSSVAGFDCVHSSY